MRKISEAEAYRRWHAADRAQRAYLKAIRRIRLEVECLETDLAEAVARQAKQDAAEREEKTRRLVDKMFNDKAFNRTLRAFTGHSAHGWAIACGVDGRMKDLLRDPGWDILGEAIRRIRIAKGLIRR